MKNLLFFLLSFIFFFSVRASHQVAGDIGYTCLGNNQYEFYLIFYRDCSGIAAPSSMILTGQSYCGNISIVLNAVDLSPNNPNSFGIQDTVGLCSSYQTICNGGIYPGNEIYKFSGIATITPCSNWSFCATTCCRNDSVSFPPQLPITTFNKNNGSMAYSCSLNNADGTCDNSPIWTQSPVKFVCQGVQTTIDNSAIDPDGDSLVYELIDAWDGCGNGVITVSYKTALYNSGTPFSATYPLSTVSGTFPFDQSSGISLFTPKILDYQFGVPSSGYNEIGVIAVKISSYRNGNLKGTIMRDMQVVTMQGCDPLNSMTQGVSHLGDFTTLSDNFDTIRVVAGNFLDFTVLILDPINVDSFNLYNTLIDQIPQVQFVSDTHQMIAIMRGITTYNTSINDVGIYNFDIVASNSECPLESIKQFHPFVLQILENPNSILEKFNSDISIYPNPTNDLLTIKLPEKVEKAQISIYDIKGKLYFSEGLKTKLTTIDLNIPKGIYFAKIKTNSEFKVEKLIIE